MRRVKEGRREGEEDSGNIKERGKTGGREGEGA